MREAQRHICIYIVKNSRTLSLNINLIASCSINDRLTTAVYTSARAAHNLNELVILFTALNSIKKICSILESGCNCNIEGNTTNCIGSFLPSISSADIVELKFFGILSGQSEYSRTKRSLHNSSGCTEDYTRTGGNSKRCIELLFGKGVKIDTCNTNHTCKLACCECNINIRNTRSSLIIAINLKFLCGTRHNSYADNILGIPTHLLRIISLKNGTEHLLRRLARGKIFSHFRIIMLAVLNPSGRARSNERKSTAILKSVKEFSCLFHNGKISSKICIKYICKSKSAESSNHFTLTVCADRSTEFLGNTRTNRRSSLNYNMFCRISKSCKYLISLVNFIESTSRASFDTLTAIYTCTVSKINAKCTTNFGIKSAVISANDSNTLNLLAGCNATTAKNTLAIVTNNRTRRCI